MDREGERQRSCQSLPDTVSVSDTVSSQTEQIPKVWTSSNAAANPIFPFFVGFLSTRSPGAFPQLTVSNCLKAMNGRFRSRQETYSGWNLQTIETRFKRPHDNRYVGRL